VADTCPLSRCWPQADGGNCADGLEGCDGKGTNVTTAQDLGDRIAVGRTRDRRRQVRWASAPRRFYEGDPCISGSVDRLHCRKIELVVEEAPFRSFGNPRPRGVVVMMNEAGGRDGMMKAGAEHAPGAARGLPLLGLHRKRKGGNNPGIMRRRTTWIE